MKEMHISSNPREVPVDHLNQEDVDTYFAQLKMIDELREQGILQEGEWVHAYVSLEDEFDVRDQPEISRLRSSASLPSTATILENLVNQGFNARLVPEAARDLQGQQRPGMAAVVISEATPPSLQE